MQPQSAKLNIVLISIHGLIRAVNPELGRDADTGGQTLYVLELAQALSQRLDVNSVILMTRRIIDQHVSKDYSKPQEVINAKSSIVRIEAGPPEYLPKEELWDHLDEFADNAADYLRRVDFRPDIIHSHYADAGFVGSTLARMLGVPLIHTGHSLGRVKRLHLLASGLNAEKLEALYNMSRRIEAEEMTLATAERVIASTHQEIEEQYELYDHYQPDQMRVVPPGTNLHKFTPPVGGELDHETYHYLSRHLYDKSKPIVLALSRPDKRKNIIALIEAFGESPELQKLANLVIVAGKRDDIDELGQGAREVFQEMLIAIDRYELNGMVTLPKHHERADVAMFYRIAAASGGVFVNPALTEPFGLTLIEAAASGLPIVATEDGGPRDIMRNCRNGILIDPLEISTIAKALVKLLKDKAHWQQSQQNGLKGVAEFYSWDAHANGYMEIIKPIALRAERLQRNPVQRRSLAIVDRAVVTDLDLNLIGDKDALRDFLEWLKRNQKTTGFIVATGRRFDSALRLMKEYGIPESTVLITSSGSEIHYAPKLTPDTEWARHIDYLWTPHKVRAILKDLIGLKLQPKEEQSQFKLSYYIDPQLTSLEEIRQLLHREEQSVHVQMAFGQYLDILPQRASKGLALRYVANLWQVPLGKILVAGGSGADEDMMRGNTRAVVVANRHHEELSQLGDAAHIYFASKPHAAGILEALDFYGFNDEELNAPSMVGRAVEDRAVDD